MPPEPLPVAAGGNRLTIGTPAVLRIGPRVSRVRLTGMLFDTDKCFLLPSALTSIRAFKTIWNTHPTAKVLVVGHADRAGDPEHNRRLSVERARAIVAYLSDDREAWLRFYSPGVPPTKSWGAGEDAAMLSAAGFATLAEYQAARGLAADGAAGPDTRRALIGDYMAHDGTQIPAGATIEVHGCGESHPEIPTADGVAHEKNRRVEIYLFDDAIDPAPVDPCPQPAGCTQQPLWAGASKGNSVDLGLELGAVAVTVTSQLGAPVAGADVHLSGFVPRDAQTGADGIARLADVLPTHYEVFARKTGFTSASTEVDVPPGGELPVPLVIAAAGGALEVRVRDGANAPVAAARVDVTGPGPVSDSKQTDAAGLATFAPAAAGAWDVTVTAGGFEQGTAKATVQSDQTTTTVVTLASPPARWLGSRVTLGGSGASLVATPLSGGAPQTLPDAPDAPPPGQRVFDLAAVESAAQRVDGRAGAVRLGRAFRLFVQGLRDAARAGDAAGARAHFDLDGVADGTADDLVAVVPDDQPADIVALPRGGG